MILSAQEIELRLGTDIRITDYDKKRLNPNSYNLRLGNKLLCYTQRFEYKSKIPIPLPLDPKIDNPYVIYDLPESGYTLQPGQLYLAQTLEHTETYNLVPMIEGRSSWGRLGLFVHATAGFGDIGFKGHWTLEMSVIRPLIIYPGLDICQIFYHTVEGAISNYKSDKYQNNTGVQPSMIWKEFAREKDSNSISNT